ncbi:MAG: outer membrane beta-barrel protein [Chitinophagales bacterium]
MRQLLKISFFLAFVISQTAYGQMSIGISTGLNYSTNKFDEVIYASPKARTDFFIGVSPSFSISEKINLSVTTQYSRKGYQNENDCMLCSSVGLEYRSSYIDVIPEIEYKLLGFLTAGVGFNYGFLINEQSRFENNKWSEIQELISPSDFGLTGKLKVTHNNFFGLVRYNFGLKNISNISFSDENGDLIVGVKQYNRNLQLGVGYAFNAKKK